MSRNRDTSLVAQNGGGAIAPVIAGKNVIINGDMAISQRATSWTGITAGTAEQFSMDRYSMSMTTVGTWTISQDTDVPINSGLTKSQKWLCTTANASLSASSLLITRQRVESANMNRFKYGTSAALPMTVSFWVKSNVTGTYNLQAFNPLATARNCSMPYTINSSNTWEYKTIVIPPDISYGFTATYAAFDFWLAAGSNFQGTASGAWANYVGNNAANGNVNLASAINNYWSMTGLQVETGSVATSFSLAGGNVGSELALCQRYYQVIAEGSASDIGLGLYFTNSQIGVPIRFPVVMRGAPTLSVVSGTDYYRGDITNPDLLNTFSAARLTKYGAVLLNSSEASGTAGQAIDVYANNANAYIAFSSEL